MGRRRRKRKYAGGAVKYNIVLSIETKGIVEESDVCGALFGELSGLLGDDLELRDLADSGKIGRIKVDISSKEGKTSGEVVIPSNLEKVETAIIAAATEVIKKIGPAESTVKVERIEDVRKDLRKQVISRARELLGTVEAEEAPDSAALVESATAAEKARPE